MAKVRTAVRFLGSSFFQEYTAGRKGKGLKTYDNSALAGEEIEEFQGDEEPWIFAEEVLDDETLKQLSADDPDAALTLQFENAIQDSTQDDSDLAVYFSSYLEHENASRRK